MAPGGRPSLRRTLPSVGRTGEAASDADHALLGSHEPAPVERRLPPQQVGGRERPDHRKQAQESRRSWCADSEVALEGSIPSPQIALPWLHPTFDAVIGAISPKGSWVSPITFGRRYQLVGRLSARPRKVPSNGRSGIMPIKRTCQRASLEPRATRSNELDSSRLHRFDTPGGLPRRPIGEVPTCFASYGSVRRRPGHPVAWLMPSSHE